MPVVEPLPVDGAAPVPLDELVEPGEETVWDPLHELEYWTGFCGAGKSPQ